MDKEKWWDMICPTCGCSMTIELWNKDYIPTICPFCGSSKLKEEELSEEFIKKLKKRRKGKFISGKELLKRLKKNE